MATLYELRVVAGHRFNELSIRLKNGKKVWVGKDKATVISSKKLAQGEEFTIERYEKEGRMIVAKVDSEAKARAQPKAKRAHRQPADLEV